MIACVDCSCHDEAFKCDRSLANQTNTSIVVPPHLPCDSPRDCYSHCDCGKSQLFTNHILNRMLAVIACHVCGSPPMNVTWYRQDRPLPEGAHCSTETGKTHLLLSNVTEDDCGFYVCVARNAANITYASKVCVYLDQCELCIGHTQYNTIQYNTMQCNTIQYNTIQYNTIQYNATQLMLAWLVS